jgi:hypothetical protein
MPLSLFLPRHGTASRPLHLGSLVCRQQGWNWRQSDVRIPSRVGLVQMLVDTALGSTGILPASSQPRIRSGRDGRVHQPPLRA